MILKGKSEEVIFFMASCGNINNCHSEYFALAQYRLREESQTDSSIKTYDFSLVLEMTGRVGVI